MYCNIELIGWLGDTPELLNNQSGNGNRAIMSIATRHKEQGEDVTTWHRVLYFDPPDFIAKAPKGSLMFVSGRLNIRTYTPKDESVKRLVVEVIANRCYLLKEKQATE